MIEDHRVVFTTPRQIDLTILVEDSRLNLYKGTEDAYDPHEFRSSFEKITDCTLSLTHSDPTNHYYDPNSYKNTDTPTWQPVRPVVLTPTSYDLEVKMTVQDEDILVAEYTYRKEEMFRRYTYHRFVFKFDQIYTYLNRFYTAHTTYQPFDLTFGWKGKNLPPLSAHNTYFSWLYQCYRLLTDHSRVHFMSQIPNDIILNVFDYLPCDFVSYDKFYRACGCSTSGAYASVANNSSARVHNKICRGKQDPALKLLPLMESNNIKQRRRNKYFICNDFNSKYRAVEVLKLCKLIQFDLSKINSSRFVADDECLIFRNVWLMQKSVANAFCASTLRLTKDFETNAMHASISSYNKEDFRLHTDFSDLRTDYYSRKMRKEDENAIVTRVDWLYLTSYLFQIFHHGKIVDLKQKYSEEYCVYPSPCKSFKIETTSSRLLIYGKELLSA